MAKKPKRKTKKSVGEMIAAAAEQTSETKISARPLDDRVVIRIDDSATVSPGGILLVQSAQEQSQLGVVVAVGPGAPWKECSSQLNMRRATDPSDPSYYDHDADGFDRLNRGPRFPMSVEVGDRVMISRYGGAPLEIDDEEYTIIRESDILAVVK